MENVSQEQLDKLNDIIINLENDLSSNPYIIYQPSMKDRSDIHTAFDSRFKTDVNFRNKYSFSNSEEYISIQKKELKNNDEN